MLELDPLCEVKLLYGDRKGGVAQMRLRYPASISPAEAFLRGMQIHSVVAPLTSAVLLGVRIVYRITESAPGSASEAVPAASNLALFYRNGEEWNAIYVPAPTEELWETDGPFAGIRLDLGNPAVVSLLESLNLALAETGGEYFVSMGGTFVNGGRAI